MKEMTKIEVQKYFKDNNISEPIPRKGKQVVRVFPNYLQKPTEIITNLGNQKFSLTYWK